MTAPRAQRLTIDGMRQLAGWYRNLAERAGSMNIWERRLHPAEDLKAEADRIERAS